MKLKRLQSLRAATRINWVICPALAILSIIYFDAYFAFRFLVAWLVLARVWEFVAKVLIRLAMSEDDTLAEGPAGTFETNHYDGSPSSDVPTPKTAMMMTDLAGRFVLPWLIVLVLYLSR